MEEKVDVLIVGAGPAGGQCARLLRRKGYKVKIIDRVISFAKNNFSSAGTPKETVSNFELPNNVVQSWWSKIEVWVNEDKFLWKDNEPVGAVLDFEKLRKFLASNVQYGTDFRKANTEAKVVVDASGSARAVISTHNSEPDYLTATGVEYLVKLTDDDSQKFDKGKTVYFLGKKWISHGYCWIFPAGKNIYKIGAGTFKINDNNQKPLKQRIEDLIRHFVLKDYEILDIHGSTLRVTKLHEELFYKDNVIAVGDAISSVNWLGGEGIRHGLYSGTIAAEEIDKYLKGEVKTFANYEKRMRAYFGHKWLQSIILSKLIYFCTADFLLKRIFKFFTRVPLKDFMHLLFDYEFLSTVRLAFRPKT